MSNDSLKDRLVSWLGIVSWRIYVRLFWRRNKGVQKRLTDDIGRNLGYYLYQSELFDFAHSPKAGNKR